MLDYKDVKCPVCGVPFKEGDDIVVCPECGAPYHRECYQKEGKCIFDDLHEKGQEWQPPAPPKAPVSAEIKDQECPVCGTLNAHSALFCNRCGASLTGTPGPQTGRSVHGAPPFNPVPGAGRGYAASFSFDPMGGVSPADVLDAGVTFGDASKLVKQNTGYYMPVFRYIKQTGRNKFNFSAFLFSGAWMLFRKQYKWGAVVTALVSLLYLGYFFTSLFVSTPIMLDLMTRAGVDINGAGAITNDQLLVISQLLGEDPMNELLVFLPFLFLALMLIVMFVVGFRGNRMYMKHCIETVRMVRANEGDGDPNMTLSAKGGVNPAVAICIGVCWFMISNFIPLLL